MVGALIRSALIDLPVPVPVAGPSTDNSPYNANANPARLIRGKTSFQLNIVLMDMG